MKANLYQGFWIIKPLLYWAELSFIVWETKKYDLAAFNYFLFIPLVSSATNCRGSLEQENESKYRKLEFCEETIKRGENVLFGCLGDAG